MSYRSGNVLTLKIEAETEGVATVAVGVGDYNLKVNDKAGQVRTIAVVRLSKGRNEVSVPIPWDKIELVAHPTAFSKKIGGKFYNVYHFIHIQTLRELHAITGRKVFLDYAEKMGGLRRPVAVDGAIQSSGLELRRLGTAP